MVIYIMWAALSSYDIIETESSKQKSQILLTKINGSKGIWKIEKKKKYTWETKNKSQTGDLTLKNWIIFNSP